jgi:hypothetical protein
MTGGDTGEDDEAGCRIQERRAISREMVSLCDNLRARAPSRLDHITLTAGAAALAVATNTLWIPFRPKASSPRNADGRPAQVVDVTLTRRAAARLQLATISHETLDSRARTRAYS